MTVDQYEEKLQENLLDLETRLHRQSYRPHPSLRRDIPKGNGKTRPLGIATFFLGFTHYCGHSRAGKFKLKRRTATKKLRAKFRSLKDWFRESLTKPTADVWRTLCAKLQGHFQYYNVNDNWRSFVKYREAARRMALRWLRRRSQNSGLSWDAFKRLPATAPVANPWPDRGLDCNGPCCTLECR